MIKTFICHGSPDHPLVAYITERLRRERLGLDIFVDDEKNRSGDDLQKMLDEVKRSVIFIPVMSDESLSREFVRNEINTALATATVNVFPVNAGATNSNIPAGIKQSFASHDKVTGKIWTDFSEKGRWEIGYQHLLEGLVNRIIELDLYQKDERFYEDVEHIDLILSRKIPTPAEIKIIVDVYLTKESYQTYFFRRLDNAVWLKYLNCYGFFRRNPSPIQVPSQTGAYTIPHWNVLDYLEKVADEVESAGDDVGHMLMEIVRSISDYRDEKGERIDNYGTDWSLVKIMAKLPVRFLDIQDIDRVSIYLGTRWGVDLAGSEIGEALLPKLIKEDANDLAAKLLGVSIGFRLEERSKEIEVKPLIDRYWLNELMTKNTPALQKLFPLRAAQIVLDKIEEILAVKESLFSIAWLPAIEDHEQNSLPGEYQNILVRATRDFLHAAAAEDPEAVSPILKELLGRKQPVFQRLALHMVATHWNAYSSLFWGFARPALIENPHLKHEVYELFRLNFTRFSDEQKAEVISWIRRHPRWMPKEPNWSKEDRRKYRAYRKLEWLSALKESGDPVVLSMYQRYLPIAGQEPEHPSFSVGHSKARWVSEPSPIQPAQMLDMPNADLAQYLRDFQGVAKTRLEEPSKEGLASTLRKTVKDNPQKFATDLQPFVNVDRLYQDSILSGFSEAWKAKNEFDWKSVLGFCREIVASEGFWSQERKDGYDIRDAIICDIAGLIEEGTKDDSHAFDAVALPLAEEVLIQLLDRAPSEVSAEGDLWDQVHNGGKGRTLSAIINYSLRYARLGKSTDGSNRWVKSIKDDFTKRLDRSFDDSLEFSFTLGEYLPNLYYLDEQWVKSNINNIFLRDNDRHWHAAFTGYLASPGVYDVLHDLLRSNGHYAKALITDFVDQHSKESLIHHLCIGYLQGKESLTDGDSLFLKLLLKWDTSELKTMVHYFSAQQEQFDTTQKERVLSFWEQVFEHYQGKISNDLTTDDKELLSDLLKLTSFLGEITPKSLEWLKLSVPLVDINHNNPSFLKELARLVTASPGEVGLVCLEMLQHGIYPTYKKVDVISIVEALYNAGEKEQGNRICNAYGEAGQDFLRSLWERHNKGHNQSKSE
ncbi:MAG: toll/interleukin-1 receptor domain-containing protein [Dehalococcoidia bacterium]|nr:toll/interleukin-1 receptor domain-containing protein [Dehalococcoidia bacterium]